MNVYTQKIVAGLMLVTMSFLVFTQSQVVFATGNNFLDEDRTKISNENRKPWSYNKYTYAKKGESVGVKITVDSYTGTGLYLYLKSEQGRFQTGANTDVKYNNMIGSYTGTITWGLSTSTGSSQLFRADVSSVDMLSWSMMEIKHTLRFTGKSDANIGISENLSICTSTSSTMSASGCTSNSKEARVSVYHPLVLLSEAVDNDANDRLSVQFNPWSNWDLSGSTVNTGNTIIEEWSGSDLIQSGTFKKWEYQDDSDILTFYGSGVNFFTGNYANHDFTFKLDGGTYLESSYANIYVNDTNFNSGTTGHYTFNFSGSEIINRKLPRILSGTMISQTGVSLTFTGSDPIHTLSGQNIEIIDTNNNNQALKLSETFNTGSFTVDFVLSGSDSVGGTQFLGYLKQKPWKAYASTHESASGDTTYWNTSNKNISIGDSIRPQISKVIPVDHYDTDFIQLEFSETMLNNSDLTNTWSYELSNNISWCSISNISSIGNSKSKFKVNLDDNCELSDVSEAGILARTGTTIKDETKPQVTLLNSGTYITGAVVHSLKVEKLYFKRDPEKAIVSYTDYTKDLNLSGWYIENDGDIDEPLGFDGSGSTNASLSGITGDISGTGQVTNSTGTLTFYFNTGTNLFEDQTTDPHGDYFQIRNASGTYHTQISYGYYKDDNNNIWDNWAGSGDFATPEDTMPPEDPSFPGTNENGDFSFIGDYTVKLTSANKASDLSGTYCTSDGTDPNTGSTLVPNTEGEKIHKFNNTWWTIKCIAYDNIGNASSIVSTTYIKVKTKTKDDDTWGGWWGGWGGGALMTVDYCPDGDESGNPFDGHCSETKDDTSQKRPYTPPAGGGEIIFIDIQHLPLGIQKTINDFARRDIISKQKTKFRPNNFINRAELTKIALKTFGIDIIQKNAYPAIFPDVSPEAWFMPYVFTAKQHDIIQGYINDITTFKPWFAPNIAESIKIAIRAKDMAVPTKERIPNKVCEEKSVPNPDISFPDIYAQDEDTKTRQNRAIQNVYTLGDSWDEIRSIQEKLQNDGYYRADTVTGTYDAQTAQAVARFQMDREIIQSFLQSNAGHFGQDTRNAFNTAYMQTNNEPEEQSKPKQTKAPQEQTTIRKNPSVINSTYYSWDKDFEVLVIQHFLFRNDYFNNTPFTAGIFGKTTANALARFQKEQGLIQTLGEIGAGLFNPETKNAFNSAYSKPLTYKEAETFIDQMINFKNEVNQDEAQCQIQHSYIPIPKHPWYLPYVIFVKQYPEIMDIFPEFNGIERPDQILSETTQNEQIQNTYTLGAQNNEIRSIQEKLQNDGYYRADTVTWEYDAQTAQAVARFQRDRGIIQSFLQSNAGHFRQDTRNAFNQQYSLRSQKVHPASQEFIDTVIHTHPTRKEGVQIIDMTENF